MIELNKVSGTQILFTVLLMMFFGGTGVIDIYGTATNPAPGSSKNPSLLTLHEAIQAALEHNHQIRATRIGREAASDVVTRGNAGQLPTIAFTSEVSGSYSNLEIQPGSMLQSIAGMPAASASPGIIDYDGVSGSVLSAGVGAEYIIYDGNQGATRYRLLEKGSNLASLQHQAKIEQTLLETIVHYHRIVFLQQVLNVHSIVLQQSSDRYRITQTRTEYGISSEQDQLQALVDLKSDSTSRMEVQLQLDSAIRDLHVLIGWDRRDAIQPESELILFSVPDKSVLQEHLFQNNTALHSIDQRVEMAGLQERLARSRRMPVIRAQARYGYTRQYVSEGLFERQEQLGIAGGITVSIPIYTGNRNRSGVRQAEAVKRQEEIYQSELIHQLQARFDYLWDEKRYLEQRIASDLDGLQAFERNYERAADAYERGFLGGIGLRAAQLSLQDARIRLAESRIQQVINATTLLYLSGTLVSESR